MIENNFRKLWDESEAVERKPVMAKFVTGRGRECTVATRGAAKASASADIAAARPFSARVNKKARRIGIREKRPYRLPPRSQKIS